MTNIKKKKSLFSSYSSGIYSKERVWDSQGKREREFKLQSCYIQERAGGSNLTDTEERYLVLKLQSNSLWFKYQLSHLLPL